MVLLSERTLIERINRKLRPIDKMLRIARPRAQTFVGRYYIQDLTSGVITAHHCDPEALGRRLGVLQHYESSSDRT